MDYLTLSTISSLISNMGFPIFTAIYFMVSMKKTLESNTQVMNDVKALIEISNGGAKK